MVKKNIAYTKARKKEGFYKEARKINVRARSYFKLKQLDAKFSLIHNNMTIIDLGAAPGGWLEYIDQTIKKGRVIGIDLLEIKKPKEFSKNIELIQGDFTNLAEVDEFEEDIEFDLVLSDMAPEFSGNSQVDRGRTHKLNIITLDFCKKHLKKGKNCAFKSFEGEDLGYVIKKAKEVFNFVKEYKPQSSQKKSAEMFVMCFRKR